MSLALFVALLALGLVAVVFGRLHRLQRSIDRLQERLDSLRQTATKPTPVVAPEKLVIPQSPLLVPPPPSAPKSSLPKPAPVPAATAAPFNWEAFMGVKLF